jgi:hypothetical protein
LESDVANTWDTLDQTEKVKLARHLMAGKPSNPDNLNRAMSILAHDPKKLDEAMQACYGDTGDQEMTDAAPDAESSIEDNVQDALAQESSADMQQTGRVASDIPPPEQGEDMQAYVQRLMALMQSGGRKSGQSGAPSGKRMMDRADDSRGPDIDYGDDY